MQPLYSFMNIPQNVPEAYNLLFNLVIREHKDWYYINTRPRYDPPLADYMLHTGCEDFVRFETPAGAIYLPLVYKSLTGMHLFGSLAAISTGSKQLSALDYTDAAFRILQQYFSAIAVEDITVIMQTIKNRYETLLTDTAGIIPESVCVPQADVYSGLNRSSGHIPIWPLNTLINEYAAEPGLKNFQSLLSYLAVQDGGEPGVVALKWLRQYFSLLVDTILATYASAAPLPIPDLLFTEVEHDEQGNPVKIYFKAGTPLISLSELPGTYNIQKLHRFLQSHLLQHHIFPLIRAIGLLGICTETVLTENISLTIASCLDKLNIQADWLFAVRMQVKTYLPAIFNQTDQEYTSRYIQVYNPLLDHKYYAPQLIKPEQGAKVHQRYFEGGTLEIGLRAFNMDTDIEILHEWVNQEYAKKFWEMDGPIEELEAAYMKHMGVDYSHPYIGTLNGEPIFTLELYWAIKDEVGKYYNFHPGDYGFHMLIAPARQRIPNFSYYALTMCIEHFFAQPQVHRMIGEASVAHKGTHNLITKVGCEFDKALVLPYKTSNLTFLTRGMYQEEVQEVLDHSRTEIIVNTH